LGLRTTAKAPTGDFSFPLLLGPDMPNPINYGDAATVNLFYWMNRAHDLHYLSGFDEAAGNFQVDNFGRGGVGNDPIYAYSHYGAEALTAGLVLNSSFSSRGPDDGSESTVRMYLSAGIGSAGDFFTDGSYDSQVMVHEYTHGVSTRLVRQGYNTFQGASMGEAWSDFFALEYTLADGAPPGEIWVEALWEARANLIKQFGEKEGRRRVRLLVIDGMKLSPPTPSMVDMRDAILLADRVDFKGASQDQLWTGFAKRGLGALAYSSSGDTAHVISSFELPSTTGSMRFYDNPIVQGEQIRVVRIQLTSGAGDVEDLILHRVGSIYTGAISSSTNTLVAKFEQAIK
jgi:extracellular elastinolytic metalloproteinase